MLQGALMTARILWGAILMSVVLFLVVLQIVPRPPASPDPVLAPTFAAVALAIAVVSFLLPRHLHRSMLAKVEVPVTTEADPGAFGSFYREAAPSRRIIADREAAHRAAVACFMTPHVLRLALSESIALFGFVLGFLGHAPPVWAPFFAVGAVLIAIRFPTARQMIKPLEEALGATIAGDDAPARG